MNVVKAPELIEPLAGNRVRWRGRVFLYFGGCDYFRLSRHPAVLKAVGVGVQRLGLSVAASRTTTGQHPIYEELENRLARFFQADAALLVSSGYLTSAVVAQALVGDVTHAFIDARAHPALQDAARQLKCAVDVFGHRDAADLRGKVHRAGARARVLVLTDGLFSMDGAVAPLRQYVDCLPPGGQVLLDDAHGAGVLGEHGRGTIEMEELPRDRIIQCITLSKAFGTYGGAVIGSRSLRRQMWSNSGTFIGTTPLPLPLANAALQSVSLLERGGRLRARLHRNADHVKAAVRQAGLALPDHPGPIVPVQTAGKAGVQRLRRILIEAGIYPSQVSYPGASNGLFRFVISSEHTQAELARLIEALARFKGGEKSGGDRETGRTRGRGRRRPATR